MRTTKFILLICLLSLISCASVPTKLTREMRQGVKIIKIEMLPVELDPNIYTTEQTLAGFSAFIFQGEQGIADAEQNAAKQPRRLFGQFLTKNNIDISAIVKEKLTKQLTDTKMFTIGEDANADTTMKVSVTNYGFGQDALWSDTQKAMVYLKAELFNKNNEALASIIGFASPFRDTKAYKLDEIFKTPDGIKQALEEATVIAVNDIVERMTSE